MCAAEGHCRVRASGSTVSPTLHPGAVLRAWMRSVDTSIGASEGCLTEATRPRYSGVQPVGRAMRRGPEPKDAG